MASDGVSNPEVLWAQRSSDSDASKNWVSLTLNVPDIPKDDHELELKATSLTFTGTSTSQKTKYHLELEFYAEIDPAESKIKHSPHSIVIKLQKKDLDKEFWPRLTKGKLRLHFLKVDFDRWVDEDEQNEAPEEDFSQFGGMGGMPGMGGDFGGIDFSKLAGGAEGMPDLEDVDDAEDVDSGDDDDEEEEVEEVPTTKA